MFKRDLNYEKKFWDREFTPVKIENLRHKQKFIQSWIEKFWKIPKNPKILEVGGAGTPIINFFQKGEKYSLDPLINFYKKKFPEFYMNSQVHNVNAEAENMSFSNNTFDLIIGLNVLDHTEHPNKVMKECSRILKKEGVIVLSVDTFNLFWKIFRRFLPFFGFKYYRLHPQTLRTADVKRMLQRNNLRIIDLFVSEKIMANLLDSLEERIRFHLKYNLYRTYILAIK